MLLLSTCNKQTLLIWILINTLHPDYRNSYCQQGTKIYRFLIHELTSILYQTIASLISPSFN